MDYSKNRQDRATKLARFTMSAAKRVEPLHRIAIQMLAGAKEQFSRGVIENTEVRAA